MDPEDRNRSWVVKSRAPVPEVVREARCKAVLAVTVPPVMVRVRVRVAEVPGSVPKVAVPAVLVKVVPGDQDCGPVWMKVPELVTLSEEARVPLLLKVAPPDAPPNYPSPQPPQPRASARSYIPNPKLHPPDTPPPPLPHAPPICYNPPLTPCHLAHGWSIS